MRECKDNLEKLEKLLKRNCPFCDADPINLSLIITEFDTPAVYCNECNVMVESAEPDMSVEGLIKIWNREAEE